MRSLMLIAGAVAARIGAGARSVFSSRGPGGGLFSLRPLSHTDGYTEIGHVTKAPFVSVRRSFLNESTRGLFVNYMSERADYGR